MDNGLDYRSNAGLDYGLDYRGNAGATPNYGVGFRNLGKDYRSGGGFMNQVQDYKAEAGRTERPKGETPPPDKDEHFDVINCGNHRAASCAGCTNADKG